MRSFTTLNDSSRTIDIFTTISEVELIKFNQEALELAMVKVADKIAETVMGTITPILENALNDVGFFKKD